MNKHLVHGTGWRLGYSPDAQVYGALVGTETWAIELTHQEFQDFLRLGHQLIETMQIMASELSEEENLTCSAETLGIFMEAKGFSADFTIYLQVLSGRRVEGIWSSVAIAHILEAANQMLT